MPTFVAYHGLGGAEHQQRVDTLSPQGYRPISLCVSGDPPFSIYSAVWVQRPGPSWWAASQPVGRAVPGEARRTDGAELCACLG